MTRAFASGVLAIVAGALLPAALLPAALPIAAQEPAGAATEEDEARLADLRAFVTWLAEYRVGAIRLMHRLEVDEQIVADADAKMTALAKWNNLAAAKKLFEAAVVDPQPDGARSSAETIDFQAELQPWKIRTMAQRHIAAMSCDGLEDWLLAMLESRALRSKDGAEARADVDAALRILGRRDTARGKLALLKASRSMPPALRLRAVDVLSEHPDLELVEHFIELLRDVDPKMRIAALNAIGNGLGPHTDETEHDEIPVEIAAIRDTAIDKMTAILKRDKVWQVRAAACHNLAALRCRDAVPALIAGLGAELGKKKEPWAMDVRLHRTLEGMTGMRIPAGDVRNWEAFWRNEGPGFRLAKPKDVARLNAGTQGGRYAKFFSLSLDSDRLLFVVDFSGSMQEDITLQTETTSAKPGTMTTKARLVVEEMKKIIMSLPDGSYFNIIVFSDDVRVWRPGRDGSAKPVRLDDETRDDLLGSFLDRLQPRGPTNLYGALDRAIGFLGRGLVDVHYDLGFDTIYLLSDGAPSYGAVTDKSEIRRLVREANRLKRLTVHAITFGQKNDTDFLRELAKENGGRHIHIE